MGNIFGKPLIWWSEPKCEDESKMSCPICLEPLKLWTKIENCGHKYCYECIVKWSRLQQKCPLCRQKFKNYRFHNDLVLSWSFQEVGPKPEPFELTLLNCERIIRIFIDKNIKFKYRVGTVGELAIKTEASSLVALNSVGEEFYLKSHTYHSFWLSSFDKIRVVLPEHKPSKRHNRLISHKSKNTD